MTVRAPAALKAGLVVTLAMLAIIAYRAWRLAGADRADGHVVQVYAANETCGVRHRGPCTTFSADVFYVVRDRTYRLREPAGGSWGHDQPVSGASLQPGDTVPIAFDPADPADHYAAGWQVLPAVAPLVLVVGAVLIGVALVPPSNYDDYGRWGRHSRHEEDPAITLNLSGPPPSSTTDQADRPR
jgi:hypothetical protein